MQSISAEQDNTALLRFFGWMQHTNRAVVGDSVTFMIREDLGDIAQEYAQWLQSTHRAEQTRGHVAPRVAPLVRAGEILLFDYRVRHRGLPNDSPETRPVAYMTYAIGEARDTNFPDAATLA